MRHIYACQYILMYLLFLITDIKTHVKESLRRISFYLVLKPTYCAESRKYEGERGYPPYKAYSKVIFRTSTFSKIPGSSRWRGTCLLTCTAQATLCAFSSSMETDPWKARGIIIRGRTEYQAKINLTGIILGVWPKWEINYLTLHLLSAESDNNYSPCLLLTVSLNSRGTYLVYSVHKTWSTREITLWASTPNCRMHWILARGVTK